MGLSMIIREIEEEMLVGREVVRSGVLRWW